MIQTVSTAALIAHCQKIYMYIIMKSTAQTIQNYHSHFHNVHTQRACSNLTMQHKPLSVNITVKIHTAIKLLHQNSNNTHRFLQQTMQIN